MFRSGRKPKPGTLLAHLLVTLAYPAARALRAPQGSRLLVFTDTLTVIALVLLVCGIVYALVLRGDLDISEYIFSRGLSRNGKSYAAWKADKKEEREEAFNYPLFLGIVYLIVSAVIAWGFY